MPTARHHHAAAVVGDKLFVIGGRLSDFKTSMDTNEMYDPIQDKWKVLNPMPIERSGLSAVSINTDIFVIGGQTLNGSFTNINQRYDTESGKWTLEKPMPTIRDGHHATVINNKIYVVGGKTAPAKESVTGANEIFIFRPS